MANPFGGKKAPPFGKKGKASPMADALSKFKKAGAFKFKKKRK